MARGVPAHFVRCACGSPQGYPKSGLCAACTSRQFHVKYTFTPAMDDMLRTAFTYEGGRAALVRAVDNLTVAWKMPRHSVYRRAGVLGLRSCRRMWSRQDLAYLRGNAGIVPLAEMCRHLHRTGDAVKARLSLEHLSARAWTGLDGKDVMRLLRVGREKLAFWRQQRWLVPDSQGAYSQGALEQFLRRHVDALDLRRVDQAWLRETLMKLLQPSQDTAAYDRVASGGQSHCRHFAPGGYDGFGSTEATQKRAQRERLAA